MAKRTGGKLRIPEIPELSFRQTRLLEAFAELSTDRQIGMQEGPIPWSSVRRYAEEYGYNLSDLSDIIRVVDGAYLEYQNSKRTAGNASQGQTLKKPKAVRKASRPSDSGHSKSLVHLQKGRGEQGA